MWRREECGNGLCTICSRQVMRTDSKKKDTRSVRLSKINMSRLACTQLHGKKRVSDAMGKGIWGIQNGQKIQEEKSGRGDWKTSHGTETLVLTGAGDKARPRWPPSLGPSPRSVRSSPPAGPASRSRWAHPLGKGCPDPLPPTWPTPSSHLRKDPKWGFSSQPPRSWEVTVTTCPEMFAINKRPKWPPFLHSFRSQCEAAVPWIGPPWPSGGVGRCPTCPSLALHRHLPFPGR